MANKNIDTERMIMTEKPIKNRSDGTVESKIKVLDDVVAQAIKEGVKDMNANRYNKLSLCFEVPGNMYFNGKNMGDKDLSKHDLIRALNVHGYGSEKYKRYDSTKTYKRGLGIGFASNGPPISHKYYCVNINKEHS